MKLISSAPLLLLAASALPAAAGDFSYMDEYDYVLDGCLRLLKSSATFCEKGSDWKCYCKNTAGMDSVLHCAVPATLRSHDLKLEKMYAKIAENCPKITVDDLEALYNNASLEVVDLSHTKKFNKTQVIDYPVDFGYEKYLGYYNGRKAYNLNVERAVTYGSATLGFWGILMVICGAINWISACFPRITRAVAKNAVVDGFRRHFALPPTGRVRHTRPATFTPLFEWLIPTRFESSVIFIFFSIELILNCVHIHTVYPNSVHSTKTNMLSRYVADRSGITSLFLIPLLFLFASRNNILMWLTRWPLQRFLLFHRWIARFFFLLVLAHSVAMYIQSDVAGKLQSRAAQQYFKWGVVATFFILAMLVHSLRAIRRQSYEVFVLSHVLLAVFMLVGTWIHVRHDSWQQFTIAATALWCFDRAVGIGRLCAFGSATAEFTLVPGEDIVQVSVRRPKYWKFQPGQFAYLYVLAPQIFWQSHPFTVLGGADDDKSVSFYLRVKGGATAYLHKQLVKAGGTKTFPVSVEGPYGFPSPHRGFRHLLLLASGNGVPSTYAYAHEMVARGLTRDTDVRFVWCVRTLTGIEYFRPRLEELAAAGVSVLVHVTRPESEITSSSNSSTDSGLEKAGDETKVPVSNGSFELKSGRPNLNELIREEFAAARGNTSVISCGHNEMTDAVRRAVADNLTCSRYHVEFSEDLQVW